MGLLRLRWYWESGIWNYAWRTESTGWADRLAMYSQPAIIIGSEDAERAIENLNAVKTLNKTFAEQAIRVEADAAILRAAADERKKKQEEERLQQAKLERERLANEEQERIREEARRMRLENDAIAAFNKYAPQIRQKITKNWNQVTQKSFKTGVIVEIDRSGGVQSVTITEP